MTYLLDTNIVSYALQARRHEDLARAASVVPMAIAEEVRNELTRDRLRGAVFGAWFPTSNVREISIVIGTPAHSLLADLNVAVTNGRGRGERASIALAATDFDLVFVANDKNALWLALRELHGGGERIVGLPVFLRRIHELAGASLDAVNAIMNASALPKPTWWARWISPPPP